MHDTIEFRGRWRYVIPADIMRDNRISFAARGLWSVMSSYVGEDRTAFPSRKHLMKVTGLGYNYLKRLIDELKSFGLLEFTQETKHGKWQSCRYVVVDEICGHPEEVAATSSIKASKKASKSSGHPEEAAALRRWPKKGSSLRDNSTDVALIQGESGEPPSPKAKQSKLALAGQTPVGGPWPLNEEEVVAHFEVAHRDQLNGDLEKSAKTYFRKYAAKNWRMPDGNVIWDWKGYAASVWIPRWVANRKTRKKALQKRSTLDVLGS